MRLNWLDRTLVLSSHHITLCTTPRLFKKALKHLKIPKSQQPDFLNSWHADATSHYFENQHDRSKAVVVCIPLAPNKTREQVYALIVHEAVHIWQQIEQTLGDIHSPETEAYAIQNITQSLIEEYDRQITTDKTPESR